MRIRKIQIIAPLAKLNCCFFRLRSFPTLFGPLLFSPFYPYRLASSCTKARAMPFFHNTPESRLPRSDSKNPATTCKGITTTGRPCRRALGASARSSPNSSLRSEDQGGVLAVLNSRHLNNVGAAAFYCWQHKDQAERLAAAAAAAAAAATDPEETKLVTVKGRTSIDTLVDRLGVVDLEGDGGVRQGRHENRRRRRAQPGAVKRGTLPAAWHDVQGPLLTVPEKITQTTPPPPARLENSKGHGRSNTKASIFCCIQADGDDQPLPNQPRHRRQPETSTKLPVLTQTASVRPSGPSPNATGTPSRPSHRLPSPRPTPPRPPAQLTHSNSPQTQTLLSLIPPNLSPQTYSALLSELAKPISAKDKEGYIYMYWLTPESEASRPDDEAASSLLEQLSDSATAASASGADSRGNEALRRYASVRQRPRQPPTRTVLLKIGKTGNVHRRLSQWSKQCGHDITLLRYYPYHTSSSSSSSSSSSPSSPPSPSSNNALPPRKVPHMQRVERLIHIELADKRVAAGQGGACGQCGQVHQEIFEIEATLQGLRGVDRVVRRWVEWDERIAAEGNDSGSGSSSSEARWAQR